MPDVSSSQSCRRQKIAENLIIPPDGVTLCYDCSTQSDRDEEQTGVESTRAREVAGMCKVWQEVKLPELQHWEGYSVLVTAGDWRRNVAVGETARLCCGLKEPGVTGPSSGQSD